MIYDHRKIEKEMLEFFEKHRIYEKAKERNAKNEPYYFCDGPPYATGHIHPGTAWNKTLKDVVCRYWRMRGFDVRCQPGYDTHGLPIEVKVEQELGIKKKQEIEEKGIGEFVEKCKAFADRYMEIMTGQFKQLGVWMDWETPYITYKDDYIEASWKTIRMAHEKGLMHEGIYVLPCCYRCETTMANYELEYGEETDPSIYVKFRVKGKENEYFVIWTTTPWTLAANMAAMVNPKFSYVKAKIDDDVWITAKERLDHVLALVGKSAAILEEFSGKKMDGVHYEHPFQDLVKKKAERKVVLSDEYVSLENGTGIVHCAPGHGQEDFLVGKKNELEVFNPVDEAGVYTSEAGELEGKNVRAANKDIIALLRERGMLVHEERIKHRYPHCWRCKTPLIFRATDQWFISVSKLKEKMLSEIETVEWHPEFAKERFREFVSQAPDWCISRQRYWGIPLPIWKCAKCAEIKVIGSKEDLFSPANAEDMVETSTAGNRKAVNEAGKKQRNGFKELHRPYVDEIIFECKCGGKMERVKDVLDVWFDSGNAVWASTSEKEKEKYGERADFILEGQDQVRGWFYSLLGSGLLRYDKIPYKRLMMHGFFVDEKGEKMSKSLGNFVPIEEIVGKYGADGFRLWGISNMPWDELKFNWNELREANGDLGILFNMGLFLERFYPKIKIEKAELEIEDKWLLSRLNSTLKEYHKAFESYVPNLGVRALRRFLVEDLSRFYMKIAKDRIGKGENAEGAFFAIYSSTLALLKMFSVVSPFISEHAYQQFFRKHEKEESVAFLGLEVFREAEINTALEKRMTLASEIVTHALEARQRSGIKLRWPIREVRVKAPSDEVKNTINELSGIVRRLLNAKEILIVEREPEGEYEPEEFEGGKVFVNKKLDEELYEEGVYNEVKRRVQQLRKELALVEKDKILLEVDAEKEIEAIVKKFDSALAKETNAASVLYKNLKDEDSKIFEVDGRRVKLRAKKD